MSIWASENTVDELDIHEFIDFTALAAADEPAVQKGRVFYADDEDTLSFYNGDNVEINIGRELLRRAKNNQGADISKADVVYLSGATGTNPEVKLAQANSQASSAVFGLALTDISDQAVGKFVIYGRVQGIDTSSFSAGDVLYLSESSAGSLKNTKPTSPNHAVRIGVVVNSDASNGEISVDIDREIDNFTSKSVPYVGSGGQLIEDNSNLSYDDSTQTLSVDNVSLNNGGLGINDSDASHTLTFTTGSNLTANHSLSFDTGDASRTVTINGNSTLNDWFDQSVKTTAGPTFAGVTSTSAINLSNSSAIQDDGSDWIVPDGSQNGTFKGDVTVDGFIFGNNSNFGSNQLVFKTKSGSLLQVVDDVNNTLMSIDNDAQSVSVNSGPLNLANSHAIQDAGTDAIGFDGSGNIDTGGTLTLGGNLIADAQDISTDTTTGTKIGTGSNEKLGFFGGTPAAQQTAPNQLTDNTGGSIDQTLEAIGDTTSSDQSSGINNNFAELRNEQEQVRLIVTNLSLAA